MILLTCGVLGGDALVEALYGRIHGFKVSAVHVWAATNAPAPEIVQGGMRGKLAACGRPSFSWSAPLARSHRPSTTLASGSFYDGARAQSFEQVGALAPGDL